jgi:hypothetical protein
MKMKICETCGNEIASNLLTCPFCGSRQRAGARKFVGPRNGLCTVNVESGMPTVEEGLKRLDRELRRAEQSGIRVVRVIHGWGSTGKGGALRQACRAFLKYRLAARRVSNVIYGEDYSRKTTAGRGLMGHCPELRGSERSDCQNPGITFVEF